MPDEIADDEHRVREQLVEGIVLADDELMSRYLDGDALSMEELEGALSVGLRGRLGRPCGLRLG